MALGGISWRWRWRQYRGLAKVYLMDGLAYRAQGFIWILTDVITAMIMPQVLIAAGRGQAIAGFQPGEVVVYYLTMLLLASFITSHFMWDISVEIREGVFSSHIIRPVNYFEFMLVRNFVWRCIRCLLFLPLFALMIWLYSGQLGQVSLHLGWEFWLSVILGHLLSLSFVTAFAMVALFTQEAQSIFELYYVPTLFLSGQMFPVAMFPGWVQAVAHWTPFYYTVGAPTELAMGRLSGGDAIQVLLAQVAWIAFSVIAYHFLFRAGMKRYASVGM